VHLRAILTLAFAAAALADDRLEPILNRVSEEAEVFQQQATSVVGRETLHHRGRKTGSRFRIGKAALDAPKFSYLQREIVSEYGFSTFQEAPEALREFRQVISVDGRGVLKADQARLALAAGMSSEDDRLRKRMLQDFERYGTIGAATDFGQMLLLFRRRGLAGYEFEISGPGRMGAEEVIVIRYRQKESPDAFRVYHGREMTRVNMSGELWVRASDYIPLRVTMQATLPEDGIPVIHSSTTDYLRSSHGLMLPAAVHYKKMAEGQIIVENRYQYSQYQMFKVEAEIKFIAEDTPQP